MSKLEPCNSNSNQQDELAMIEAAHAANAIVKEWFVKAFPSGDVDVKALLTENIKDNYWSSIGYEDAFTQADIDSEKAIIAVLKRTKNIPIVAKESGHEVPDEQISEGSERWLIDPIDGTSRFKNGSPEFSVTIALQKKIKGKWETEIGIVSLPMEDKIYLSNEGGSYVLEGDKRRALRAQAKETAAFSGGLDSQFQGKKIEIVIYSKDEQSRLNPLRTQMEKRLGDAGQRSYSTAMMIAKIADNKLDGIVMAGNAFEYAWDVDAAIHVAQQGGAKIMHKTLGGEPCVLIANSQSTLTALNQMVNP